jgi:hypothetical protein
MVTKFRMTTRQILMHLKALDFLIQQGMDTQHITSRARDDWLNREWEYKGG